MLIKKIILVILSLLFVFHIFNSNIENKSIQDIGLYLDKNFKTYIILDLLELEDKIVYLLKADQRLCLLEFEEKNHNYYLLSSSKSNEDIGVSLRWNDNIQSLYVYFTDNINVESIKCRFYNSSGKEIIFDVPNVTNSNRKIFNFQFDANEIYNTKIELYDKANNIIFERHF